MRSIHVVLVLSVWFPLLLASCDNDQPSVTNSALSGNITGRVLLTGFDPHYSPTDLSGTVVKIEGRTDSTSTDSSGVFTLRDVPAGIHTLAYSHQGYGICKIIGFQFTGGGTAYVPANQLNPQPLGTCVLDSIITVDTVSNNSPVTEYIFTAFVDKNGLKDPITAGNDIVLFMGTNPNVSSEKGHYSLVQRVWTYSVSTPFGYRKDSTVVYSSDYLHNFHKGDTVYTIAYVTNTPDGDYPDPATDGVLYSSVGLKHSVVRSFVLR
ncbi:MAG: hypothetical protein JSS75_10305 [Bacteroidetes bacterium]|nr:hypothetical protein [Bacteroidota bacterium]